MTIDADAFSTLQGQVESGHPVGGVCRLSPGYSPEVSACLSSIQM